MSSITLHASPWSGSSSTKKRTPSMNRKKTCRNNTSYSDGDGEMQDTNIFDSSFISENFESAIEEQGNRNLRVNQLLNKITDAGDGLADFVPVAAPKEKTNKTNTLDELLPTITNKPEGFESSLLKRAAGLSEDNEYAPNNFGEDRLSNYARSYEPKTSGLLGKPYYTSMGIGPNKVNDANDNNTMMQKLNYITHILEDMQMEKTSNVTEELILYSFLGVFIIFVTDSFAKAGKYYR